MNSTNTEIKSDGNNIHLWMTMRPVHKGEYLLKPEQMDIDLHNEKKLRKADMGHHFWFVNCSKFSDGMTFEKYRKAYIENEEKRSANYKDRKKRFGTFFDIQLPLRDWGSFEPKKTKDIKDKKKSNGWEPGDQLRDFVKDIAEQMIDSEQGLKWCAWIFFLPGIKQRYRKWIYVRIWISDREMYSERSEKELLDKDGCIMNYYKSTRYINSKTGRFCKKNDPDAVLLYKKGQLKSIETEYKIRFKDTKTTRFKYRKGWEAWAELREWMLGCYENALNKLGMTFQKALLFKRRKNKFWYSKYVKRCVTAENKMQRYMEEKINELYDKTLSARYLDMEQQEYLRKLNSNHEKDWKELQETMSTNNTWLVIKLRDQFQEILDEKAFTDQYGIEYSIKGLCNYVEMSFEALRMYFDFELNALKKRFEKAEEKRILDVIYCNTTH